MRSIEFRVWDTRCKRLNYMSDHWMATESPNLNQLWFFFNTLMREVSETEGSYTDDKVFTQYTGLLDKNKKKIFEGDIVRIKNPNDICGDFKNTIGQVFYWEEESGFYHGNSAGRPPKRMWNYCEVIGNIWENPKLLEEK